LSALTGIKVELEGQNVDGLKKGIHLWKKWQIQEEEKKLLTTQSTATRTSRASHGNSLRVIADVMEEINNE
jgi:hypothetical protein